MINRKLVETPVRMMNRMEEITDLICEYNEEVQKQQEEIERLTKQNKALNEMYELTKKEYIRLNNIIKEVREYITRKDLCIDTRLVDEMYKQVDFVDLEKELLEILDKGE